MVRAVGTAFAVRCEPRAIDVVVTEGIVQVRSDGGPDPVSIAPTAISAPTVALVPAGNRATVARSAAGQPAPVAVNAISREEIDRTLAWSGRMIELAGATLGELVAEFSRRSGRRIEVSDAALRNVRIGGRFPIDDLDGFVRGLEEVYQVQSERSSDGAIVLRPR
jgi:ferric-dicitrate binding protein FerR (iron transport regulator)